VAAIRYDAEITKIITGERNRRRVRMKSLKARQQSRKGGELAVWGEKSSGNYTGKKGEAKRKKKGGAIERKKIEDRLSDDCRNNLKSAKAQKR